jgi:hypothetical protein
MGMGLVYYRLSFRQAVSEGEKVKKYLPLLFCLFIIGCTTTEYIRQDTECWRLPEVYVYIEEYVKDYGEPPIIVHAVNKMTGDEYVDLYWEVGDMWHKVYIYKDENGWEVREDWLKKLKS